MQFPSAPQQVSPYTPAGGAAPIAQELQGLGRGNDSMLMHVTPGEVQGLQALAQQYGTSLTTNPQTGLPEAGVLESILPLIAGGLLSMTGIGAPLAALMVGGGTAAITGDLKQGLMAGLGAFGGAGLAGALGAGAAGASGAAAQAGASAANAAGAAGANAVGAAGAHAGALGAGAGAAGANAAGAAGALSPALANIAPHVAPGVVGGGTAAMGGGAASMGAHGATQLAGQMGANSLAPAIGQAGANASMAAAQTAPNAMSQIFGPKVGDFAQRFGNEVAIQGMPRAATTGAAAMGLGAPVLDAMAPKPYVPPEDEGFNYEGPYRPTDRQVRFRGPNADLNDSSEFSYFANTNPYPGFEPAPRGYAMGGPVGDFGPSVLPGQQAYKPPVDMTRAGVPPTLGGPPSSMGTAPSSLGNAPETGAAGASATDRMLRRPGSGYRAGMGAEHNWNFRPIARPMDMASMSPMRGGSGGGGGGRDMMSPPSPGGKGLGALIAAVRNRNTPVDYGPARSFQYDPLTQSVSDAPGFAAGGVALKDGAFVMDARTVSEMGNGSSRAGQELLARHGGKPITGPGDGVSDSIPAKMAGGRPARVARDEVKFDPDAVRRIGRGDVRRGAEKLYALMDKAQHARKVAGRGADTKLRKAL